MIDFDVEHLSVIETFSAAAERDPPPEEPLEDALLLAAFGKFPLDSLTLESREWLKRHGLAE